MENKINAVDVENHLMKTSLEIIYNRNIDMDTIKDISGMVLLNGSLRRTVDIHVHENSVTISKKALNPIENLIKLIGVMEIPANAQTFALDLVKEYGFEIAILTSDKKYKEISGNIFKNWNESQKTLSLLIENEIVQAIPKGVKKGVRAFFFTKD